MVSFIEMERKANSQQRHQVMYLFLRLASPRKGLTLPLGKWSHRVVGRESRLVFFVHSPVRVNYKLLSIHRLLAITLGQACQNRGPAGHMPCLFGPCQPLCLTCLFQALLFQEDRNSWEVACRPPRQSWVTFKAQPRPPGMRGQWGWKDLVPERNSGIGVREQVQFRGEFDGWDQSGHHCWFYFQSQYL